MSRNPRRTPEAVAIHAAGRTLQGLLRIPTGARAVVPFAHGSGSGRLSPRNNFVAEYTDVLALNRGALAQLTYEAHLEVIPGATRLFVEPGALEQLASLAADWFARHAGRDDLDT